MSDQARLAEIKAHVTALARSLDKIGDGDWTPQDHAASIVAGDAEFLLAALREAERRAEEAEAEITAAKQSLCQFNHVEGESLTDIAAVAESAYGFAKHRADEGERRLAMASRTISSLQAAVDADRRALRAIQANAEAWHGPPEDEPRRAAALSVIARWADDPTTIPDGVNDAARAALASERGET